MKSAGTVVLIVLLTLSISVSCFAKEISAEKSALIKELIEVTGSKDIGVQLAVAINQSMSNALKSRNKEIPERAFDIMNDEINKHMQAEIDGFVALVVPIYDKHYTQDELKELLKFYKTDLGRKTISALPQILNESMAAGQKWGQSTMPKLVEKIQKRFKQEGIAIKS